MKITKNIGSLDMAIRLVLGGVSAVLAFFWVSGVAQGALVIASVILLVTAGFRSCALYTIFGVTTCPVEKKSVAKIWKIIFAVAYLILLVLGSYASIFFTKKFFLEDYSRMNQYYKQTLFFTGQNKRDESVANYTNLVTEYTAFYEKYSRYQPYALASDEKFASDLLVVKNNIDALKIGVLEGDLSLTHTELESIRPIFQDILKRNNFSMFAVYLVDFHDAMENIITAADAKNAAQVISFYSEVDEKLKAVEGLENSEEVQAIRKSLEILMVSARGGEYEVLSSQAAALKSSFVKVYLKRG